MARRNGPYEREPASTQTPRPLLPYERMFESMLDGVLVAGTDGRVVLANEAAARIFEVPIRDLLVAVAEYPARFALREPPGVPALPVAQRALRGEIVAPVERLIHTGAGAEKTIRTSAAPLRDERGAITGAIVLVADFTAQKAEAERARQHAARLQKALEERAAALVDAQHAAELLEHGDGLVEVDRDWVVVRVNAAEEGISGKSRSEIVGRVLWEVWPEAGDPSGKFWREYHRCMEQRVPVQFEAYFQPLETWFGITAYPTSAGGIAVFLRNITATRRAEDSLRGERDFTSAIFDTIVNCILVLDRDGRIVRFNKGCESATGYSASEVIGKSVFDLFIPADEMPGVRETFRQLRMGHFPSRYQNRWRMKDGSERLIEWSNTAIADERGEVRFVIGTGVDVTERERLLETLRDNEQRLREHAQLLEYAPVLIRDPNDRIIVWNQGMERLYGWRREEALGHVSHELLKTHFPQPLTEIVEVMERNGRWQGELHHQRNDGSEVIVASTWLLHSDAEGHRRAVIEVNTDLTGRRRAEAALKALNEQLRETDRRRTEFLGVLSHELRNPLAPIRNSTYLLDRVAPDGPQAARAREVIKRQTEHLTRLVDDLLDVTRISRGKVHLSREVVDLRDVVRKTCDDHKSLFVDAGVQLTLEFPDSAVSASVDSTRIAQVVGNLLHNAAKFTPSGGEVTVRLRARDAEAELTVRDDGAGISRDQLGRMFEPFAQEDRSLARTQGGLGLGLALSKGLVELHGGSIAVRSDGPGKGAEFTITLPLAARSAEAPAAVPGREGAPTRRRVLVIEDNSDAASTLADVLELQGHEVALARNGRTGIQLARQVKPDVVLCDLGLPDVDGYEVARTLRNEEALRGTRLIALSGYAQPEDTERAREAGFEAHLPKPARLEDLAALLA